MRLSSEKAYYPSVLEHKPGFFLSRILYILFKRVQLARDMTENLRKMHREGTVVYAIKYRSHLDYLLYHYRFRSSRLPYPKIAFGMNVSLFLPMSHLARLLKFYFFYFLKNHRFPSPFETGFFKNAIKEGTAALLCLVDPKGFSRHFVYSEKDHLHFLLETQMEMEKPIFIIPQLILYKKAPEKDRPNIVDILFGFKDKPGLIRKTALFFRHNRRALIDFGKPFNLKTYLDDQPDSRLLEDMAIEIRKMLIENIDLQKRIILGPVLKSRQQMKEQVLKDKEIIQEIEKQASGNSRHLKKARKEAGKLFDEIAADYNITYIQLLHIVLSWLWKKCFEGIDVDTAGLADVREWARKGSLVYVPSHKSHIDYLVLNYILYDYHMHIPRIAAGQNLAFWPMGHVFRKCGAFFIRRAFKGTSLYPKIFARYVKQLLAEGHSLEFFIEGGRSRSGKLMLPKTGFLSILLQAYFEGHADDLVFVPASINYDRILEESSYLKEIEGKTKDKESFRQVLRARKFLKRKYGKIYIQFGHPISLRQYLNQKGIDAHNAPSILSFDLTTAINKVTLVTPVSLMATAILTRNSRGFLLNDLTAATKIFMDFLHWYGIRIATTLKNFEKAFTDTLSILIKRKIVELIDDMKHEKPIYHVHDEKKRELEYYKNSIIHFFISHAFVAVSLLTGKEETKTEEAIINDFHFLRHLFKNEFIYEKQKNIGKEVEKATNYFLETSCIKQIDGRYKLTRLGYECLPNWAALTHTFLESYWIAVRSYMQSENPKKSDLLKQMDSLGLRYYKLGIINHFECVSHITFENAIRLIREDILEIKQKADVQERLLQLSQKIYDLCHY